MIKKIIQVADIHIPNDEKLRPYTEMLKKAMALILKEVKKVDKDECRIVLVGDIFHKKIRTTNEAKSIFHTMLNYLNQMCRTYVIAGNHDMLENNNDRLDSISPTFDIKSAYPNITYLDKELNYKSGYCIDDNVIFALYSMFDNFAAPNIIGVKDAIENGKVIGLYHGDMPGTVTDLGYMSDKGVDASLFEGCDCVMAGHIHKHQEIKKNGIPAVYAGSLFQQDFGENTTGHGFVVWDLETMKYKFHEVPNDYKMYKFEINSYDDVKNDSEKLLNY